ncbi:MAG TPA: T9SS type A sorting domain-containing protein [Ignavibacteria bacterium]|nr:T9SS type A sorting domain-containing protein [Ignavibacteria bacterium]HMR39993.1 T9SS type A sorting domain-containing protein [Ignavibacteria bacterium]
MKKLILLLITISFLPGNIYSQYSSPESVTYDSTGSRYLISNTSSSKIVQRDLQGVVTDFVTVGGGIHGITVFSGRAYVCNGNKVRGYNLTTAAEEFNVTLTGSSFLNDIAIDNSGMAYVSDFTNRRIYKLNTNNSDYWIYVLTTNQPNGVYVDAVRNRLLICCWGGSAPVKQVNFADSVISNIIITPYSNCDGISLDRNDNVYISTWGIQSVVKYDINFTNAPVIVTGGLSNPADIYVNKNSDTLAVPNAGNSTVTFYFLNNTTSVTQINSEIPSSFILKQNYPNPFNPSTNLEFGISESGFVSLKIYDGLGREVAVLVNESIPAGNYKYQFSTINSQLSGGVYFYRLEVDGMTVDTKQMILLK